MNPLPIRLFNTATRAVEDFKPLQTGRVGIYACGPTVYNFAHIGNMRTYVFEDLLRRTLVGAGYEVNHVMNVTDVGHLQSDADAGDDKMMVAAARERKSPWDIARSYEEAFFRHSDMLNILRPHTVCRATDHIQEMIDFIADLVEKGFAYESGGNVYFEVSLFPRYADFAQLRLDDQQSTERVEADDRKRHQADFALWFSESKYPNQIMKWESPWGVGFPGWHIECSAMASKYLGERFDIHCGGIDHVPVHHTNEIAQSECRYGHKWANYWLHGEFLIVDDQKMSKSSGDILTIDTLSQAGYDPLDYRYLLLTAHYRNRITFSYDALDGARNAHRTLRNLVRDWRYESETSSGEAAAMDSYRKQFWAAVTDDLAIPKALRVAWAVARDQTLSSGGRRALLLEMDKVFGLDLDRVDARKLTNEEAVLIEERLAARAARDFKRADEIRDLLLERGIRLKDRKDGTDWESVV